MTLSIALALAKMFGMPAAGASEGLDASAMALSIKAMRLVITRCTLFMVFLLSTLGSSCSHSVAYHNLRIMAPATSKGAEVPIATVEGPIPYEVGMHGFAFSTVPTPEELAIWGYTEEEFFFCGTESQSQKPYKSRMMVRHPIVPERFNGTVVVEWINVTGGTDINPGWMLLRRQILRDGYAYVGVSAQAVDKLVAAGFMLEPDAEIAKAHAARSGIGR